ncbi:MAG: 4-hydroxythreonine-4-phosphate dehydrogenase PdxA [Oligoflexia bacterium]|nr:4-hydroxythreonine-4-phosphate dehydrogenase PdxA [Oligoflexia bacterium]
MSRSTSSSRFGKIHIAITQGESNGICPEIITKALEKLHNDNTLEFSVVCTRQTRELVENSLTVAPSENIHFVIPDTGAIPGDIVKSEPLSCLYYAAGMAMEKKVDAVVTAPIDKGRVAEVYPGFTGHTGFLKEMTGADDVLMLMSTPSLKVGIMTEHIPVSFVSQNITPDRIVRSTVLLNDYLLQSGRKAPLIGILSLNPHAGDNGIIGSEEKEIIIPAMELLSRKGINVAGPLPADTAFTPSGRKKCNAFLAMYHDQGMIPVKSKGLDYVVNISLGLPIIRTSPGHGVGYDIAGKNVASPGALLRAIDEAGTMVLSRRLN